MKSSKGQKKLHFYYILEEPEEKEEIYHVSIDWVLESTSWNEWLNEQDYQLEENGKVS